MVVTLYKEFLQTLPSDKHDVEVFYKDAADTGQVEVQFTVKQPDKPAPKKADKPTTTDTTSSTPKTGDRSHALLWVVLAIVAGMGMIINILFAKRKRASK